MSGRPPSDTLAVDADILAIAIMGRRVGPETLLRAGTSCVLLTPPEEQREARRVLTDPRLQRPAPDVVAEVAFRTASVQPNEDFENRLAEAVASANGSATDSHVRAFAWAAGAGIWSHDRDFRGAGWSSWSTRNFRHAFDL